MRTSYLRALPGDLGAGVVVFLVALPLCLGVALGSGAPLVAGLVSGIVAGVLVAWLSGSHTSISGPAAGLTAIVAAQIQSLGSFEAFLVVVCLTGLLQIALGVARAGSLAAYFPSSVIEGLLAAIGILLVLKQIPHLLGHDADWFGDMSFAQPDGENTLTELVATTLHVHPGAAVIGLASLALLLAWDRTPLRRLALPPPLVAVLGGAVLAEFFSLFGDLWRVGAVHLVQVPEAGSLAALAASLPRPDWAALGEPAVAGAAVTVAVVASLETLLNLEAVDKLDPAKRVSPPNRELVAQGLGNLACGLLGGLPMTSVVVRSSVGIEAGAKTRLAAFFHGALLLATVTALPVALNRIPLACLAAVLVVTGLKLAKPSLFRQMWSEGWRQFLPFLATVVAIVFTDLLVGILIGLAVAVVFILRDNLRQPLREIHERHASGEVIRIELAEHVTFLSRARLREALDALPAGSQVVLDARGSLYVDPEVGELLHEFQEEVAPEREIRLSLVGFRDHLGVEDRVTHVDVSTREVRERAAPRQVLDFLLGGNLRFAEGRPVVRDLRRQVEATAAGQYPLAVVLGCMDSRVPVELIFDLGVGDVFSVRVAGNVPTPGALGSIEYGCAVAGAKLVLVLGHTRCGAVAAAIEAASGERVGERQGCAHLPSVVEPIAEAAREELAGSAATAPDRAAAEPDRDELARRVAARNVRAALRSIAERSPAVRRLESEGRVLLAGALYDVATGRVELLESGEGPGRREAQPSSQAAMPG